ncbi:GNAT family N-acetyltransferase [Dokdonia sinensis]|uniref:GNAT family N-acetyltransferase n=1 Tax=Dokdonia sinensis TaxID=2479847 RepID=A0A3M0GEU2_9FLAO|nr:GNAT family N-acetyltransferase [Dokdonia sinensis]RMB63435.1 GNAT family N-acetyltransferase [Dokdonia sinensis]
MGFTIRKAQPADMPAVLELITELAVFEKEPDAVKINAQTLVDSGFGENRLFTCFVATLGDKIVGMALVYFRFSTWAGKSLHLEDLIVKQEHRGKGIGKGLYDQVMLYGAQEDVKRVEWVVLDWNKEAIDFYDRSGAQFLKDWYLVQMDDDRLKKYVKQL